jgi:cytochrome c oxidase assembly protein subunit 15
LINESAGGALSAPASAPRGLERFAWGVLGYLILVVLFGAWVRITGSGAGCGSHWPTCHGEIIPRSPEVETVIEYTHRLTSGLLGMVVVALTVWSFMASRGASRVRVAALVTLAFTVLEAAIGAGLVLAELVASDDSAARAVVVAIHLVATFSLTGACALTAWWAGRESSRPIDERSRAARRWLWAASVATVLVSMTGAVTALGDTLFPVSPAEGSGLLARLRDDLSPSAHFLVRLRVVHPVLAALTALGLVALPRRLAEDDIGSEAAALVEGIRWAVVAQVVIGVGNIGLGAPGWMQIVHLAVAQLVWILIVLALASARSLEPAARRL